MAALNNTATHLQHASCHSSVFVMGILPMAAGFGGEHSYRISAAVSLVNRGLSRVANSQDDTQRLRVVDCGNEFLVRGHQALDVTALAPLTLLTSCIACSSYVAGVPANVHQCTLAIASEFILHRLPRCPNDPDRLLVG